MKEKTVEERIEVLKSLLKTQCVDGTWDYDQYQFGMANGMILALSILEGSNSTPYLDPPEIFRRELELLDKLNNSSIIVNKAEE